MPLTLSQAKEIIEKLFALKATRRSSIFLIARGEEINEPVLNADTDEDPYWKRSLDFNIDMPESTRETGRSVLNFHIGDSDDVIAEVYHHPADQAVDSKSQIIATGKQALLMFESVLKKCVIKNVANKEITPVLDFFERLKYSE
ncbi:MAG: hypothetical protein G01um101433_808 [Parcubacteria group bacterium Gr01-1014_33]|nr:MAG: hypothetical protein G01um101433_808 [Parcubacteria group bacterium Gr01-1014_33]